MRRLLSVALISFGVALPSASSAGTVVFGSGPGRACYEATLIGPADRNKIELCDEALESGTLTGRDLAATYVNRGILQMRLGRQLAALEDYNRAVEMFPRLGEAYVNRGASLIYLGRYEAALDDLNKGLELGTRSPHHAYYNRSIVHERLGDVEAAYEDALKAVEISPEWGLGEQRLDRFQLRLRN